MTDPPGKAREGMAQEVRGSVGRAGSPEAAPDADLSTGEVLRNPGVDSSRDGGPITLS